VRVGLEWGLRLSSAFLYEPKQAIYMDIKMLLWKLFEFLKEKLRETPSI
jgi:hypothetical protein